MNCFTQYIDLANVYARHIYSILPLERDNGFTFCRCLKVMVISFWTNSERIEEETMLVDVKGSIDNPGWEVWDRGLAFTECAPHIQLSCSRYLGPSELCVKLTDGQVVINHNLLFPR